MVCQVLEADSTTKESLKGKSDSPPLSGISFLENTVRLAYFGMGPVSRCLDFVGDSIII